MTRTQVKTTVFVSLENVRLDGGIIHVHDMSLDGDEGMEIGKKVLVDGGIGDSIEATVIDRNETTGYWYLRLGSSS